MPRKTKDPKLLALLEERDRDRATFERWYTRTRLASTKMHKAKQRIVTLSRRIEQYQAAQAVPATPT